MFRVTRACIEKDIGNDVGGLDGPTLTWALVSGRLVCFFLLRVDDCLACLVCLACSSGLKNLAGQVTDWAGHACGCGSEGLTDRPGEDLLGESGIGNDTGVCRDGELRRQTLCRGPARDAWCASGLLGCVGGEGGNG